VGQSVKYIKEEPPILGPTLGSRCVTTLFVENTGGEKFREFFTKRVNKRGSFYGGGKIYY